MGSLALLRSRNNFAVFGSLYPHHYYAQRAKKFTNYYASEGTKFFRVSWYQLVLAKAYTNEPNCPQWRQQRSLVSEGIPLIDFIEIITKKHGKIVEYDLSLALSDRQSKTTSSKI